MEKKKNLENSNFKAERVWPRKQVSNGVHCLSLGCVCVSAVESLASSELLSALLQQDVNQTFCADPLGAGQPTRETPACKISGFQKQNDLVV